MHLHEVASYQCVCDWVVIEFWDNVTILFSLFELICKLIVF